MSSGAAGSAIPQAQPPRPGPQLRFAGAQLSPSLRTFLADEAGGGAALLLATVVALLWANLPWWPSYAEFWHTPVTVGFGSHHAEMDLLHLVNDAAMSVFFLVLGLEISRQVTSGELRDRRTVLVPAIGAIGGMVVPVAIYLSFNWGTAAAHGWGIAMSTDTAFVLGLLALFGPRCPDQLRLFLLALAVVDDVAAVTVMAVFYSESVRVAPLLISAGILGAILGLRWLGVWRLGPYVALAVALWFAVYDSGVHPTLAGVLAGLLISARPSRSDQIQRLRVFGRALIEVQSAQRARLASLAAAASVSPAERLERLLHPWSAYLVVPVFGLANAGVHLDADVLRAAASSPVTIGTALALVLGNAIGITLASGLALRLGLGVLPGRVRYSHLMGGAILAGIGFTISLFIAELAFDDAFIQEQAKIGILAGSAVAAVLGATVLRVLGERSPLCSPLSELTPPELPPLPWTAPLPGTRRP